MPYRTITCEEEEQDVNYEDVEPDCNGSYKHRSILPAKPTADQLDKEKTYDMSVRDKGFAYILNNRRFLDQEKERKGSEIDMENVRHVFEQIGYEPVIHENLSAQEIRDSLEELRGRIKPTHPSVVVMIMSHGDEQGILGVNHGHVTVGEMKNIFSGQKCRALIGKPKIIFVQACRGEKSTANVLETDRSINSRQNVASVEHHADESVLQNDGVESDLSPSNLVESDSAEADIAHYYIAQSTTQGYFSLRSRRNGSFFIQALCEEFLKRSHNETLDTIMHMVTRRVQSQEWRFRSGLRTVQVPQIVKQGIEKEIFLLPKYP